MALDFVGSVAQVPSMLSAVLLRPFGLATPKPFRRERQLPFFTFFDNGLGAEPDVPLGPNAATDSTQLSLTDKAPYYRGLYNPGVHCFMNSVVQSLCSVALLGAYLDAVTAMATRWDEPTPVTDALRVLYVQLNTPHAKSAPIVPRELKAILSTVLQANGMRSLISAHQQQDAQELALLLLAALDQELGNVQQERGRQWRRLNDGLRGVLAPSVDALGKPRGSLGWTGDDVTFPFRGQYAQRISCGECGYMEAVRFFTFSDVSLTVPTNVGVCTLEQCFGAWAQLEQVEWVCHRCSLQKTLRKAQAEHARLDALTRAGPMPGEKGRRRWNAHADELVAAQGNVENLAAALRQGLHESEFAASEIANTVQLVRTLGRSTKQVMLAKPPPVLVIHLNRSTFSLEAFGASKINTRVLFPEWLDMAPYTTGAHLATSATHPLSEPGGVYMYRLSALVTHYGAHNYGHYVSFRRRSSAGAHAESDNVANRSEWARISDESVQACSLHQVLAQNPYLLFYERVDLPLHPSIPPDSMRLHSVPRARLLHRWNPAL
ncbi:ubiquitinyl hydrolase 1 [Malassezia vespertilionis]|uniref:ubiquitinyl hydrolase 1 n=1 Tax=Malassezia vespertilionis TaxID=2020962 RepID=A0A2N1JCR3_9BASI|nr:ubiquitinyl hydrolase 1 [Malassezia vespertilionis]PKI84317.1 hypothetical protein MVES_001620 [Malassezia vespertilionis]WFD06376.1 ubiquitinyl hydrolase 1 [Malassezia vespertilionis]